MVVVSLTFLLSSIVCFLVSYYYIIRLLKLAPSEDGQSYEAWLILSALFGGIMVSFFISSLSPIDTYGKLFQRTIETAVNFKLFQIGIVNRLAPSYYRKVPWVVVTYRFLPSVIDLLIFAFLCVPLVFVSGRPLQPAYNDLQGLVHSGYYGLNLWFQITTIILVLLMAFILPSTKPQVWVKSACFVWVLAPVVSLIADQLPSHPEAMYIIEWLLVGGAVILTGIGVLLSYMNSNSRKNR